MPDCYCKREYLDPSVRRMRSNDGIVHGVNVALGTIADNNRDKWEKGRHASGGTPLTVEELAELREAFDTLSSRFYGMTPTALAVAASKGRYIERVT